MKPSFFTAFALACSSAFLPLRAAELGEVPIVLPGLKLVVTDVRRVDNENAIVVLRIKADDALADSVRVVEPAAAKPPANATKVELEDPKYKDHPYSLLPSTLVDEASGAKFPAKALPIGLPFLGPSMIRSTLEPGSWIQMAVCFSVPPPLPPGPNGVAPDQKVTLHLAKAAKPLSGVVLPSQPAQ